MFSDSNPLQRPHRRLLRCATRQTNGNALRCRTHLRAPPILHYSPLSHSQRSPPATCPLSPAPLQNYQRDQVDRCCSQSVPCTHYLSNNAPLSLMHSSKPTYFPYHPTVPSMIAASIATAKKRSPSSDARLPMSSTTRILFGRTTRNADLLPCKLHKTSFA
jgi:hypothetical protein